MKFKTTNCKRCRCNFMFDAEQFRFRKYCDQCDPIAKAEVRAAVTARRKESLALVRWGRVRDPFNELAVRSYRSVARILGVSPEAVRVAEASALKHAREKLKFGMLATRTANE